MTNSLTKEGMRVKMQKEIMFELETKKKVGHMRALFIGDEMQKQWVEKELSEAIQGEEILKAIAEQLEHMSTCKDVEKLCKEPTFVTGETNILSSHICL